MKRGSQININLNAIHNNISFLRKKFGKNVKISSVVKANAYGHGIEQMAPLLEKEGIDHFSVFDYDEASRVSKSIKGRCSVMIMGWIPDGELKNAIIQGFEFYIFHPERLKMALKYAKQTGIPARVHLEAETGMNRTGLDKEDLKESLQIIQANPQHFEVCGFCTHLAGAESISNHVRIQRQLKKFNSFWPMFAESGITPLYRHVANSAASIVYPHARMQLVRIGIMQYGFWSSKETFIQYISGKKDKTDPLKRVLDWKSHIMAVKEVKEGEFIGYGISYQAGLPLKTAVIPVGYSSGYNRSLSNRGRVLIRGKRCGVIGLVNMSMVIADVTNLDEVQVGDEVILIGEQEGTEIKVSAFSDISNQLNYEVLAHLPREIERKIICK